MSVWFKRKTYGYGWYPSSWQGWLVLFVCVAGLVYFALVYGKLLKFVANDTRGLVSLTAVFGLVEAVILGTLIGIAYWKGESARWQWGEKKPLKNLHEPTELISDYEIRAMEFALREAWSKETASPVSRKEWSEENKALGQCAVTALLVQDKFGGELVKNKEHNHLWNIFPDGSQHDFTREQFPEGTDLSQFERRDRDNEMTSEGALKAKTAERYDLLKARFEEVHRRI